MDFDEYQKISRRTAIYPVIGKNFIYPTLGLVGEAGEVAEKVKKIFRDQKGQITPQMKKILIKEIGDVLWYLSQLSSELDLSLDAIAQTNLKKLLSRKKRGTLHGDGDNR